MDEKLVETLQELYEDCVEPGRAKNCKINTGKARRCLWWLDVATHAFNCVFAVFACLESSGVLKCHMGSFTFEEGESLDAASHKTFLKFELSAFDKTLKSVLCLVSKKRHENKALADILEKPLLKCFRHLYSLAVRDISKVREVPFEFMYRFMVKLRNLIPPTRFRTRTGLRLIM